MKRSAVLDTTHPIGQQLQVVQLPANSLTLDGGAMGEENAQEEPASVTSASSSAIYQALHACVHHAVAPLFNAYAGAISAQASQGSKNAPATTSAAANARDGKLLARKKLAELELSLLNLQQNVEIPSVRLAIHPAIRKAVERCAALGKRVTVDDVASNSGVPATADAPFLNHLQADVASWVREIQKVTRLSRDCASGTALAEINFWLGIEKELDRIEKQLKSEEVLLTLDVLKHAKRFHATVSFLADTGLKESADRVQKYNLLIKDFPLNDMLAATELDTIRDAIVSIFTHLNKKIKLSPYPVRRALHLVDAISRDFADQLLLVLGKKRLMMLDYDGFSAVMKACKEAFRVWDEHVKDFTSVAR